MPNPEGTARKAVAFITFSDSLFTAVESFFAQLSAMFGSIPLPNILVIDGIRLKMVTARPLNEPYINSESSRGSISFRPYLPIRYSGADLMDLSRQRIIVARSMR